MCDEVLLTAAGANFGLRRVLAPFLGAAAVFGIQVVAVCGGVGVLMTRSPPLHGVLQCAGAACLLYLGWQLLRERSAGSAGGIPYRTFGEAAALQFLSPRGWLMSLATVTLLLPAQWEQVLADGYSGAI